MLMHRIVIIGNSGAGKSTLAKKYVKKYQIEPLDLDILAWEDTIPPTRKPLNESKKIINQFRHKNKSWIIEGGYSDLIDIVLDDVTQLVFLNPGVEVCIDNCKKRPWEAHKYESEEKQNKNLAMLLNWVKEYPSRKDEFSLLSHQKIFDSFSGNKIEYTSIDRD